MSEHDPQEPPQDTPAPGAPPGPPTPAGWTPEGPSGPRASFGRRLVAYLIDGALLVPVYFILVAILGEVAGWALGIAVAVAYFSYLEGGPRGQTLGKMALSIRVIDFNTGGPIGYGRGVVRYLGKILSGLACALGFLWMLWDKEKQCWQDKIANSVVVPVQYYPVS